MKLRSRALPIVACVALVAAACAADESDDGADPVEDVEQDDGDEVSDDATDDADDDASDGDATEDADGDEDGADDDASDDDGADDEDGTAATTSGLEVAQSDLGEHLVTADGETVYAAVDQQDGEVVCTGSCAQVWPPVTVEGDPVAGSDVDEALLDTVELDDGRLQVVYDGAPLHTFVGDSSAGSVAGHGSADRWWVVSPDGALIDAPEPESDEAD